MEQRSFSHKASAPLKRRSTYPMHPTLLALFVLSRSAPYASSFFSLQQWQPSGQFDDWRVHVELWKWELSEHLQAAKLFPLRFYAEI